MGKYVIQDSISYKFKQSQNGSQNGLSKKKIIIIMAYSYFSLSFWFFFTLDSCLEKSFPRRIAIAVQNFIGSTPCGNGESLPYPRKTLRKGSNWLVGSCDRPRASQSLGPGMQYPGDQPSECAHPWGLGYDTLCFPVSACKGWIIPERKRCC